MLFLLARSIISWPDTDFLPILLKSIGSERPSLSFTLLVKPNCFFEQKCFEKNEKKKHLIEAEKKFVCNKIVRAKLLFSFLELVIKLPCCLTTVDHILPIWGRPGGRDPSCGWSPFLIQKWKNLKTISKNVFVFLKNVVGVYNLFF